MRTDRCAIAPRIDETAPDPVDGPGAVLYAQDTQHAVCVSVMGSLGGDHSRGDSRCDPLARHRSDRLPILANLTHMRSSFGNLEANHGILR